jgi:hypothetical protein
MTVQPSVLTLTPGYFSYVGFALPEMPPQSATPFEPTAEEALAILATARSGAGTYSFDGSTMTWQFLTAGVPNMVGGSVTVDVEAMSDTMTLRVTSVSDVNGASHADMPDRTVTYRRLE